MAVKINTGNKMNGLTLLTLLFIGLKLTGNIAWSWWWVLSPTLIPIAIALTIAVVCSIYIYLFEQS